MSLLYPRTISIVRPKNEAASTPFASQPGGAPYFGLSAASGDNTPIATNIPADLQSLGGRAQNTQGEFPSDAPGPTRWQVLIPLSALAPYLVNDRDIIIDDKGKRYQVSSDYCTPLGYQLEAIRLEA